MLSDADAIRQHHARWIAAVNECEPEALLGMMAKDVVLLGPGQAPVGVEGFRERLTAAHARALIRCTSEIEEVAVFGDAAYTVCRDALSVTPRAGGATVNLAGQRLTVYRRQPDGRWLLARDAHTLVPA